MLEQVIFCNDGKLRLTGFMRQALPLDLLQQDFAEKTGKRDDFYLLRYLDAPVRIEEGTTLSHMMFAIEPWADLLGSYLGRDVGAYIQEFKKEVDTTSKAVVQKESWIGIARAIRFSIDYKEEEESKRKRKSLGVKAIWQHQKQYTNEPEDQFAMEDVLCAARYVKGEEDHYSLSCMPEYRNLLVFIDNQVKVHQFSKNDLKDEMFLINPDAHSIKKIEYGDVVSIEEDKLGGLTLAEVLKAVFIHGFCAYSPESSQHQTSTTVDMIQGSESEKEQAKKALSNWYDEEIKITSEIKERVSPKDSRVVMMEDLKQAIAPEERLYNKII